MCFSKKCTKYIFLIILSISFSLKPLSFSIAQNKEHTTEEHATDLRFKWMAMTARVMETAAYYVRIGGCHLLNIVGAIGDSASSTYHRTRPELKHFDCSSIGSSDSSKK